MRIVYCINATFNCGGMEKVLMTKANYLADTLGYDVHIIRVQQNGKKNFFNFSTNITFHDLDVNYDEDDDKNIIQKMICRRKKKKIHKKRLNEVLQKINADICISMFDYEFDILPYIKDKSLKLLEYHFCKKQKVNEERVLIMKLLQYVRTIIWVSIIKKYDSFVVLTEEDKEMWGNLDNLSVIPNPLEKIPSLHSNLDNKTIIAIGRLTYQKGFDRLIDAWSIIAQEHSDWTLIIYGDGIEKDKLQKRIIDCGIGTNTYIKPATKNIEEIYLNSSLLVMTSRYEGFGMVLIEALSYGIPVISFDFPCGPKDIIKDPRLGSLIENGNIYALAVEIENWINDSNRRMNAKDVAIFYAKKFELTFIMNIWKRHFYELITKKAK